MKYFEILLLLLISVYSKTQDTPNSKQVVINGQNVTLDKNATISVDPQPPSNSSNITTTTAKPTKSTTISTTPLPTTSTTTKVPTTKPSTTPVTISPVTKPTTTHVPTTTNATTIAPVTTAKPVDPSTPTPDHHRRFDGPSFVGGIVLALGLVAIGFVAFKFYKARTELNYHTL